MTVILTWAPVTVLGQNVSYNIYRAIVSGGPYILAATNITSTSYTDGPANLDDSQTYYYKVSAFTVDGESLLSTEQTATPPSLPTTPTVLSIIVT